MTTATLTVLLFFMYGNKLSKKWATFTVSGFKKNLFYTALFVRVIWVVGSYFMYEGMTGQPFEFESADSQGYHFEAVWMKNVLAGGDYNTFWAYYLPRLSDMGYPVYLTMIYSIFGNSIIIARLIKALLGAVTVLLIYKMAARNFGESTGRIAGVLALLFPNLIYYTGIHSKETEMVFVLVWFAERADLLIHKNKFSFNLLIFVFFLGSLLYFFRTVLAYTAFLSFALVALFSNQRIVKFKEILIVIFLGIVTFLIVNNSFLIDEASQYIDERTSNQSSSLNQRKNTNSLAKYGSNAVFFPIVLIAPFPTFVNIETQQNHMLLSGGFFVKNVMGFFVLIALLGLLKKKQWGNHILILAILSIYLAILALSKFAIVERFHMPALPFFIILAAYGISQITKKNVEYFNIYLIGLAIIIVGWNWFKLAGRGLI